MTSTVTAPASSEQPKITLYWLNESRSHRLLWLLEVLKLPYELEILHRLDNKVAPPELKKLHPLGKAPVLTITPPHAEKPVVLVESAVIIEYLVDHFAQGTTLVPSRYKPNQEGQVGGETEEWMRYRHYMHYSEGSFMPVLVIGIIMSMLTSPSIPFFLRPITGLIANKFHSAFLDNEYATHLSFLETQIKTSSGKYLCGDHLTAADIIMSFPLIAAREKSGAFTRERYPELMAYLERLESEKGYRKAVEIVVEREGEFIAI